MVELLSVLTWLGFLTVLVIFQARSQRASARRLTIVAFLVAVIAAISFVFWPMAPSYSTNTRADFDAQGNQISRTDSERVDVVWWPNLRRLGARAPLIAAVPIVITGLVLAWQTTRLPFVRAVRIVGLITLGVWFELGTVSSVSWWSVPAGLALLLAAASRAVEQGGPEPRSFF